MVILNKIESLKSLTYFHDLKDDELEDVGRFLHERVVEKSEIIESEGEPSRLIYFVISGIVRVFKTSADGKEQILNLVRPGESFNEAPAFGDGPNLVSAQAMGKVILYELKKNDLKTIIGKYPQVALNVINVLSAKVENLMSLVEDLSFRHVIGRVARILLEHGNETGQSPKLTQQEMAAMAGTAREMVGRSLRALEEEGAIRLDRHRIIIRDKRELKEIAEKR